MKISLCNSGNDVEVMLMDNGIVREKIVQFALLRSGKISIYKHMYKHIGCPLNLSEGMIREVEE